MAYHRRHSTRETLAFWLLVIVLIRLALDLFLFACRLAVWLLLWVCRLLEAGADRLRDRPVPTAVVARSHVITRPIPRIRHGPATDKSVDRFMKVLGTRDRQFAADLLARGTRVPVR